MEPSVHDLGGEGARVKVRHKPANLAVLYLQDAHASVGDGVSVGGAFGHPLERRTLLGGEDLAELRPPLAEGATVARPELAQAIMTPERL